MEKAAVQLYYVLDGKLSVDRVELTLRIQSRNKWLQMQSMIDDQKKSALRVFGSKGKNDPLHAYAEQISSATDVIPRTS